MVQYWFSIMYKQITATHLHSSNLGLMFLSSYPSCSHPKVVSISAEPTYLPRCPLTYSFLETTLLNHLKCCKGNEVPTFMVRSNRFRLFLFHRPFTLLLRVTLLISRFFVPLVDTFTLCLIHILRIAEGIFSNILVRLLLINPCCNRRSLTPYSGSSWEDWTNFYVVVLVLQCSILIVHLFKYLIRLIEWVSMLTTTGRASTSPFKGGKCPMIRAPRDVSIAHKKRHWHLLEIVMSIWIFKGLSSWLLLRWDHIFQRVNLTAMRWKRQVAICTLKVRVSSFLIRWLKSVLTVCSILGIDLVVVSLLIVHKHSHCIRFIALSLRHEHHQVLSHKVVSIEPFAAVEHHPWIHLLLHSLLIVTTPAACILSNITL